MATAMATAPAIAVAARLPLEPLPADSKPLGSLECLDPGSLRSCRLWRVLMPSYCIAARERQIIIIERFIDGIERSLVTAGEGQATCPFAPPAGRRCRQADEGRIPSTGAEVRPLIPLPRPSPRP
ncbi:hypothetical protein CN151_21995 [Sinorhizobium meliloti]|nr:hypothetical protein [Sinorhizobium meliloti]MDW9548534.1 hypothetical protein [Sinorhizobium meliloti]MDW9618756.1 hypothetical protein [Sinorhizobium meliloti]MDW9910402.1 hypothetical protein [Sinorhizobium meliloti]MDX0229962.1 hypothetical protein [Sinorhizobium meliloti]